jgi:ADP-ribose pyrophosphatase
VETGENYAAAAERELREETGWKPARIEKAAEFYSSPGFTSELLIMFYASGLTKDGLPQDEDEFIMPRFASEAEVRSLIVNGGIIDCKTMCGLFWWLDRVRRI